MQDIENIDIKEVRHDWFIATHIDKKGKIWQGFGISDVKAVDDLLDNILKNPYGGVKA